MVVIWFCELLVDKVLIPTLNFKPFFSSNHFFLAVARLAIKINSPYSFRPVELLRTNLFLSIYSY